MPTIVATLRQDENGPHGLPVGPRLPQFRSFVVDSRRPYIFELVHPQVGAKAPEIVGKDVNGKSLKMSQFAGQVVVLGFWGFW